MIESYIKTLHGDDLDKIIFTKVNRFVGICEFSSFDKILFPMSQAINIWTNIMLKDSKTTWFENEYYHVLIKIFKRG